MESLTVAGELSKPETTTAINDGNLQSKEAAESDIARTLRNLVVKEDCMKFMRKLPPDVIDCTITSPPYNKMNKVPYNKFDDSLPWDEYQANQLAVLTELYRITRPGGHLWYVHKVQHFATLIVHPIEWISKSPWRIQNEITWHRRSRINCKPYRFRGVEERIYWLHKPGPKEFQLNPEVSRWGSVWFTPHEMKNSAFPVRHPATYSLYLILGILHAMNLPAGSLVYDPYGGSGTTAKACQVSNHHYLTTEFDSEYVKLIKRRLKKTVEDDEFIILVVMKQIMTNTLDLSRDLRMGDLESLLLLEPWEVPEMKSEVKKQGQQLQRSQRKKVVYYRKNPRTRLGQNYVYCRRSKFTYKALRACWTKRDLFKRGWGCRTVGQSKVHKRRKLCKP